MANTYNTKNVEADGFVAASFVDWSAVIAGALTAAVVSLLLLLLGTGLGFATVHPLMHTESPVTTFTITAAVWLIVMQWLSSALGGYLTGRLRSKWIGMHGDEVFFRDTAQGLLAWGVATLFTIAFLTSAAASIVGGSVKTTATVGAGAVAGANPPLPPAKPGDDNGYFIDSLFRSDHLDPSAPPPELRGEVNRILINDIKNDTFPEEDKAYLAQLAAQKAGIPPQEASKRVDNMIQQLDAAKQKVKEKADAARKTASAIAIITCLSMVVGAFISAVAAALGGNKRDTF